MEEQLIKRVMPHSAEAEQSVIGAMMIDQEAIAAAMEVLHPEDFYQKQYGTLFEAMCALYNEGKPVDPVTLQERLKEMNVPPEVSSLEYMGALIASVPTSANVRHYAQIVADKSVLRRLIRVNEEIANTCYAGTEKTETILEETEKQIFQVLQRQGGSDFVPIREVVMQALDRIEAASRNRGNVTGLATGFIDLDYKTSGFQNSDLILIAARPSMGKTALVLNIAEYMAFRSNLSVAVFSLEMSKEQLVNRLFSLESRVDAQVLRNGNLTDTDWANLIESAGIIGQSKLIIDDTPGISVSELRSKCRKYKLCIRTAPCPNPPCGMIDVVQMVMCAQKSVNAIHLSRCNRRRHLPARQFGSKIVNAEDRFTHFQQQAHLPQPPKVRCSERNFPSPYFRQYTVHFSLLPVCKRCRCLCIYAMP